MNKIFICSLLLINLFNLSNSLNTKNQEYSITVELDCKNEVDINLKFNNLFWNNNKSYIVQEPTDNNSLNIELINMFKKENVKTQIKNTIVNNTQLIVLELTGDNRKVDISFYMKECYQEMKYFILEENNIDFLSQQIEVQTQSYPVEFNIPKFELYANQKIRFTTVENNIILADFSFVIGIVLASIIALFI